MVTREFFLNEMTKVFEQFGANKFSQRKCDLIYLAIRHLNENEFANVVDQIIGNSRYTPNVDDFRDRARTYQKSGIDKTDCTLCSGNGCFSLNYKITGQTFAFSCACKAGRYYPAFQKWNEKYANMFTRLAPRNISFTGKKNCYEGVAEDYNTFIKKHFHNVQNK